MKIFAKRNAIDPDIIEFYCYANDSDHEPKYFAAIVHADFFRREDFPFIDANDEAYLELTEVH